MTWSGAAVRSVLIVVYFIVATLWLPDMLTQVGAVAEAPSLVRDAIVLAVWGGGLFGGLYGLRVAQRRGLI
jgi:hypothetical protein